MALYVDKLERRLEEAERSLSRIPMRAGLSESYVPYRNTVPEFSEHRLGVRAPPIKTASSVAPDPAPTPFFPPFARNSAHRSTLHDDFHHPPSSGGC